MTGPATEHQPTDRRGFISAAVAMRAAGLRVDDIAGALQLSRNAVLDLLFEADHGVQRFAATTDYQSPSLKGKP